MVTESNLSEKGFEVLPNDDAYWEEEVKEFIKRLKEDFLVKEYKDFEELVNKLTRPDLI